ncbi:hypothetical protein Tco_0978371 [Tanacetum coccineum]|uniref:Uncharacterized protein n=1 Tax=Tanacetum coccineum TaxID=301880 RepID=A0ABQ5EN22_9ASTR
MVVDAHRHLDVRYLGVELDLWQHGGPPHAWFDGGMLEGGWDGQMRAWGFSLWTVSDDARQQTTETVQFDYGTTAAKGDQNRCYAMQLLSFMESGFILASRGIDLLCF